MVGKEKRQLNSLIAQIYAAAIDRELMPEMFAQLAACLDASAGAFMLVRSEDNLPEIELLFNHQPETQKLYQEHYAALTVKEKQALCAAAVRKRFGLTAAEFAVAKVLVEGLSAKEYAEKNSISIATVRTQIRAIFDKAGVNRQTDLVRLLLS